MAQIMREQTFLNEGSVTVTNARFIVYGQTYAMSGVTSVKSLEFPPSRKGPIILIVIGIISMLAGKGAILVGILFLAAGIGWWLLQKSKYSVALSSASGEVQALTSKDGDFVFRVVNALNEAIVARG